MLLNIRRLQNPSTACLFYIKCRLKSCISKIEFNNAWLCVVVSDGVIVAWYHAPRRARSGTLSMNFTDVLPGALAPRVSAGE